MAHANFTAPFRLWETSLGACSRQEARNERLSPQIGRSYMNTLARRLLEFHIDAHGASQSRRSSRCGDVISMENSLNTNRHLGDMETHLRISTPGRLVLKDLLANPHLPYSHLRFNHTFCKEGHRPERLSIDIDEALLANNAHRLDCGQSPAIASDEGIVLLEDLLKALSNLAVPLNQGPTAII